jgi:hypothetical protein
VDYINDDLIIVANRGGHPVIYYSKEFDKIDSLAALCLSTGSLNGDSYDNTHSIYDIFDMSNEAHVFKSEDWKDALKWLIENC